MPLNKATGNMYPFIDFTYNTIKGECPHDCSYCYMKRWGKQGPLHFDEKELKTDLGSGNFIFIGSSCDMFADNVPEEWIKKTLKHVGTCQGNKYLFQTKNPQRYIYASKGLSRERDILCTTIETNFFNMEIMKNAPDPERRSIAMKRLSDLGFRTMATIEPIMDFHLRELVFFIKRFKPLQVNIGADSGNNRLPEPSPEKIAALVGELRKFTRVYLKKNLKRLYKEAV
jgi:DNA repair photolyase